MKEENTINNSFL